MSAYTSSAHPWYTTWRSPSLRIRGGIDTVCGDDGLMEVAVWVVCKGHGKVVVWGVSWWVAKGNDDKREDESDYLVALGGILDFKTLLCWWTKVTIMQDSWWEIHWASRFCWRSPRISVCERIRPQNLGDVIDVMAILSVVLRHECKWSPESVETPLSYTFPFLMHFKCGIVPG